MSFGARIARCGVILHACAGSHFGTLIPIPTYFSLNQAQYHTSLPNLKAQIMTSNTSILSGKYPAKAHAAKVANRLASLNSVYSAGTIYLESQKTRLLEDNDEPEPFRSTFC